MASPGSPGASARRRARREELLANAALRSCAARRRRYAAAGLSPLTPLSLQPPFPASRGWWETFAAGQRAEGDWVRQFGLSPALFAQLVAALQGRLRTARLPTREHLAADKSVAIALSHLASGRPFPELAGQFGVAPSTVVDTVVEVCSAIDRELLSKIVRLGPDVTQIMDGFKKLGIPHCIGAIDEISFPIRVSEGGAWLNKYSSVVLQGTVDHRGRFIDIEVALCSFRTYGSALLLGSGFCDAMDAGVYVPGNPTLTLEGVAVPPLVIADRAYAMRRWLMTPYHLCPSWSERHYNYTLYSAHCVAKCAFGQLKSRWKCLTAPFLLQGEEARWMVAACVVLHNICEENGHGLPLAQRTSPEPMVVFEKGDHLVRSRLLEGKAVRDVVARHMFSNRPHSSGVEMRG